DGALLHVESAINEATGDTALPSLLAEGLRLRWEITRDESDFEKARQGVAAVSDAEDCQKLVSLLIDHGDYKEADGLLAPGLAAGDVRAHLLAVDSRLRAG